jgi:formylglycine-generating enzyme required for sulfatase activity
MKLLSLGVVWLLAACSDKGTDPGRDAASGEGVRFPDGARAEVSVVDQRPPDRLPPDLYVQTRFVTVKAGSFTMGSPPSEPCRDLSEDQVQVTLTRSFEIASTEITQAQFQTLLGYNPSHFPGCGPFCPVEKVSWHELAAYCNALSAKASLESCYTCTGSGAKVTCVQAAASIYTCKGYRLPTEAEFELAIRGGTTTSLYNGEIKDCATDATAGAIAWYKGNAGDTPHPGGTKTPNSLGLYDLAGNVREWIHDWNIADLGPGPAIDPEGPKTGTARVLRGGSWFDPASYLRSADRDYDVPDFRDWNIGGRCVRTLP